MYNAALLNECLKEDGDYRIKIVNGILYHAEILKADEWTPTPEEVERVIDKFNKVSLENVFDLKGIEKILKSSSLKRIND